MARPNLVRRLIAKSPSTLVYRGTQEARLTMMRLCKGWQNLESEIQRWATSELGGAWLDAGEFAVLAEDGAAALQQARRQGLITASLDLAACDALAARQPTIFGTPLPPSESWPWHEDWRVGHVWPAQYFRNYDHSTPQTGAYDVKFPWELSRLGFLIGFVQSDAIDGDSRRTSQAFNILEDWTNNNPLAHSVNWYPMEAAIRGINLCIFSDLARQVAVDSQQATQLLRTLAEHGEFIERTLELTDNAGNHFTAELVALLLIGRTLSGFYARAEAWHRLAAARLDGEVMRQILADGVNFEKSTAYHRLVLELFIVAGVSLERMGIIITDATRNRLQNAAHYSAWFQRPDNFCPVVGDTDDASIFPFDHNEVRDQRPTLGVAAIYFDDADLKSAAETIPMAAIWLFGKAGVSAWTQLDIVDNPFRGHKLFTEGGVFIAKNERNFLFVDVGEVGQNGLGGHGHNDILSFELSLDGEPIVVDPGTYLYSGDFEMHSRLRSTQSHNGLQVDGEEIAPLIGNFRIGNRAKPVAVRDEVVRDGIVSINAGHTGYCALVDPVQHQRNILFDIQNGRLHCRDQLTASSEHTITRFVHFASRLNPKLKKNEIQIETPTNKIVVRWDEDCRASLQDDQVCPGFGRIEPAKTLIIEKEIAGNTVFGLDIFCAQAGPIDRDVAII